MMLTMSTEMLSANPELAIIVTLITNVGFPIFMCIILLIYMKRNDERHDNEVNNLRESIDNINITVTKLIEKLT